MLSIDPWNILWTVVNLLVLYAIFKKFLYQPVMNVINARDEMVKSQFADAKKEQEDAKALKAEYQDKLESAKTEADQIILEARDRAQKEPRELWKRPELRQMPCLKKQKVILQMSRKRQRRQRKQTLRS